MTTPIPESEYPQITDAEFVKLTLTLSNGSDTTIRYYYFGTGYQSETFRNPLTRETETYADLSAIMGISAYQRDISSTGYDTTVTVTGLNSEYIYIVAGGPAKNPVPVTGQDPIPAGYYPLIKGSQLQIFRGFYNNTTFQLENVYARYNGIITGYSINENRDQSFEVLNNTYTIVMNCSAYKKILENRVACRKTNEQSWRYYTPGDTSMDRVAAIENTQFDFGKAV